MTLTDGCGIGRVKLIGSREVHTFPRYQSTRVRLLRRADGYYAQFVLEAERRVRHVPTGRVVGIDVGLHVYLMDSDGQAVANPRLIHHNEQRLRRRHQGLSRKSLRHQPGKPGKRPTQNHAARQRATHNRYPSATPTASVAAAAGAAATEAVTAPTTRAALATVSSVSLASSAASPAPIGQLAQGAARRGQVVPAPPAAA